MSELSQKQRKAARDKEIAHGLGVDVSLLLSTSRTIAQADQGLDGLSKTNRASAVAARLGITSTELRILRRGLSEPRAPDLERVQSIIRLRLSPASNRQTLSPSNLARHYEISNPRLVPPTGISKGRQPDAYTTLFVMNWANVVHRYYDCSGTRAFLTDQEPDGAVYKVEARDPCCRGRRVCRICEPDQEWGWAALITRVLVGLHGPMMEDDEWNLAVVRP